MDTQRLYLKVCIGKSSLYFAHPDNRPRVGTTNVAQYRVGLISVVFRNY